MSRTSKWILTAIIALAAPLYGYDRSINRTLPYHGGRISVDHRFGTLTIRTHRANEVVVRAEIHASDESFGQRIDVDFTTLPNIAIRTVFPERSHSIGNFSYSVEMLLTIPEEAEVSARNRFGSIDADGVHASSEFINGQGSISFRNGRGSQRIENSFGSVTVDGSAGDTTVQNSNGSVDVRNVGGSLTINDRFGSVQVSDVHAVEIRNQNGSVEVDGVKGSATIRNSFASVRFANIARDVTVEANNGRVEGNTVGGTATIRGSFAPVDVRNVGGATKITNSNGNVQASDIRGPLTVDTRFGLVRAERVRGTLDVDNSNGGVTASEIGGAARVRTSFGSVFLKGIEGAVDVENQNGAIAVGGLRGNCDPIALKTSFSSIKVGVPGTARYTVDARTSFGSVSSDLPITITTKSDNTLNGTIGGGGCRMSLVTANGNITIARE